MINLLTALAPVFLMQAAPATETPAPTVAPADQAETPVSEEAEEVSAAEDNAMICKRETIAGSRLRVRKTCRTAQGWKKYEDDVRSEFGKAMNRHADVPG